MSEEIRNYAVTESNSRQRRYAEKPHPYRNAFDRDRDRIIHSQAFRRLEGKTQVFTESADDSCRNRLTHSLEVSQIGRTIAKTLGLNQTLTESICLAHDLGHPPFGHMGEEILNALMASYGGFEHNRQTLRIVDLIEHCYPDFAGLNLMYETRLGLAKHRSPYDKSKADDFSLSNCSLEGQVADLADRIAYNCHDLEDGMRAGLITAVAGDDELKNIGIFAEAESKINADSIKDQTARRTRTAKTIIDMLVSDCIAASKKTIESANIKTVDDVYNHTANLIVLSGDSHAKLAELEKFLLRNLYLHKSITRSQAKVEICLEQLLKKLCRHTELMGVYYQGLIAEEGLERTVCDYIAGMTDRFCLTMFEEIKKIGLTSRHHPPQA